jgi:hypothetical protein
MRQTYKLQWASKDLGHETKVALGDVTGDGITNIVAGTSASHESSSLYVFRYAKNTYHQLAKKSLGNDDVCVIRAADIDRDGKDEIIIGSRKKITIYKVQGGDIVKLAESTQVEGEVVSIAVQDIDRDGRHEIVCCVKGRPKVYIFRFHRTLVFVKHVTFKQTVSYIAIGDIDGDGTFEVIVKTYGKMGGILYIFSLESGKKVDKYSHNIRHGRGVVIAEDINNDGKCEIIFDSSDKKVSIISHHRGAFKNLWDGPVLDQDPKDITVFDIDGDGKKEIIVVCLSTVYIYGWNGNRIIPEWTQTIPNGVICVAAGELNNKGLGEIVIGTVYGYIYVIEARRDRSRGKLWVGKVQAIIQDTVSIPSGKPDAERGLEAKAKFSISGVKVLRDKVIVDGEVDAKVLYVAAVPTQPVHFFQARFPFMEFIHLYGADPGMEALVFFKVEHVNVSLVSPRRLKVTILFEMIVKLVKPFYHDHHHHKPHEHYHDDHHHKHSDYYHDGHHHDNYDDYYDHW